MKIKVGSRLCFIATAAFSLIVKAHATTNFVDHFDSGASSSWGNEAGAWVAAEGVYQASAPGNFPAAISSLPFSLKHFSVDFDINNVVDGGIWLRSSLAPGTALGIKGIALNLKTVDGPARIYWHVAADGSDYGVPLNGVELEYGNNPHVHIEVSGNRYSAFVNGSSNAVTTLTNNAFGSGRVALYSNSGLSFDNFVLKGFDISGGTATTITSVVRPAVEVRWRSQLGSQYQVQWAPRPVRGPPFRWAGTPKPPSWTNIGSPLEGTGATLSYFDTQRRPLGALYRVQMLP